MWAIQSSLLKVTVVSWDIFAGILACVQLENCTPFEDDMGFWESEKRILGALTIRDGTGP